MNLQSRIAQAWLPFDLEGDGRAEALLIRQGIRSDRGFLELNLYRQTEWLDLPFWQLRNSFFMPLPSGLPDQLHARVADIDGDGRQELIGSFMLVLLNQPFVRFFVLEFPDQMADTSAWIDRSDRFFAPFNRVNAETDTTYQHPEPVDLDGDGDLDLLLVRSITVSPDSVRTGFVFFEQRQQSDRIVWVERPDWLLPDFSGRVSGIGFADLSRDGLPDMVVGFVGGELRYYQNAGTVGSPSWEPIPNQVPEHVTHPDLRPNDNRPQPILTDIDSDGDADLLVSLYPSGLYQYLFINDTPVGITEASLGQPAGFYLHPNYPNPFNRSTWIEYSLPRHAEVTLDLLDVTGRRIRRLLHQWQPAGHYRIKLEVGNLASGLYLYRLTAAPYRQTRKLLLLK